MTSTVTRFRAGAAAVAGVLALVVSVLVVPAAPASAAVDCGLAANAIACENALPGTDPAVWDIAGAGDPTIQGFGTDISVNVGSRIDFKIKTDASAYTVDIYRTGYYGGLGARKVATVPVTAALPQTQPVCMSDPATGLYDCGNWATSSGWNVPSTAVSGVYLALLHRNDTGGESHITFVVRNDASRSAVVLQTSDTTWQAYNTYGGQSFYQGASHPGDLYTHAYKVSYNRPFADRGAVDTARDFYFGAEYPMVRFLERNGYDVSYQAGVDTDRAGALLTNHKTFVSVGHDEYWSGAQRANVEAARDAGVNLAFFSGNEMYWRTRAEPSIAGAATPNRTLVSYKETWGNAKTDPSAEWTGTWRDPRFAPTSAGAGRPENGLTGTLYMSNASDLPVTVSDKEGRLRLWRNTSLASLGAGTSAALAPHTVGYESNEDLDNGSRPAGLIRLSTVTGPVSQYLQDFGNTVAAGTTTHHLTQYRAPSGALVFSAGSIQWSWGLDQTHDGAGAPADSRMQQATVNLLADMDAQPATLMATLTAATASTDTAAPAAVITAPTAGAAVANGTQVTVTGTASDTGGGVVAAVEVSTDGGTRWHPATGGSAWTYTYVQTGVGTAPITARAIDDSANIGAATTARSVTVACPCNVFGSTVPAIAASTDTSAVELGLRLSPTTSGFISGVRFFKGAGNGGTHTGSLWSSAGARLATVTFTGESAAGWQTATFPAPVAVAAGQTYTVSYTAPQGRYAVASYFFSSSPLSVPPFAVGGGFGNPPGGVYGVVGTFPTLTYQQSNYYVDAIFTGTNAVPLTIGGQVPAPGATSVPVSTAVSAVFNKPVQAGSATLTLATAAGASVAGTTTLDPLTSTVRFVPAAALAVSTSYTASVTGLDAAGGPVSGVSTWTFTTAGAGSVPGACPCSIFTDTTIPTVVEYPDTTPVTLGVRFSASQAGTVTGVRFYKGPGNAGTHTGALWSASGTQLATATFTGESASGWQTVTFAQGVAITANTEYYASYRAPVGRYAVTLGGLTAPVVRSPLTTVANGGAYTYSATAAPLNASPTNYFVDVVFQPAVVAPVLVSTTPAAGATAVAVGTSVAATLSEAIRPGAALTLTAAGTPVAGTTTLSTDAKTLTLQPSAALAGGTTYTATVSGATSIAGVVGPPSSWSFTTAGVGAGGCPCSLYSTQVPVTPADTDASSVELGVSFVPSQNGAVTGIRFYKGVGNGGTHTGSLWSATGTRLATVTFTGEGASGWQTATFTAPVAVTSGTTYVASYLAPQGHYAVTSNFFTTALVNGPLTAPVAGNGRYLYGAGGFPTNSYLGSSYFVDVVFQPGVVVPPPPTTPTVTAVSPVAGASGVGVATAITATLSAAPASGTPTLAVSGPGGAIAGTSAFNATTRVVTFTPGAALPAGTVVSAATTLAGNALVGGAWSFTTAAVVVPGGCPCSLYTATDVPDVANWADPAAVQVGVRLTPAVAGTVSAIRFYKGPTNTGTHTVNLWSSAGTLLATALSSGESASGWQTVTLAQPVAVAAGQTVTAAYHSTSGLYSVTLGGLAAARTVGPLSTPANAGVYVYGTGFPSATSGASYGVDVIFATP